MEPSLQPLLFQREEPKRPGKQIYLVLLAGLAWLKEALKSPVSIRDDCRNVASRVLLWLFSKATGTGKTEGKVSQSHGGRCFSSDWVQQVQPGCGNAAWGLYLTPSSSGSAHNSLQIILELWTDHFGLFKPLAELWRGEMFLSKSYHLPGLMGIHTQSKTSEPVPFIPGSLFRNCFHFMKGKKAK